MVITEATLCYPCRDDEVLLAEKQKKIGAGRLNGFGGKQESGESIDETMVRETKEEIEITPTVYEKRAEILFHNPSDDPEQQHMRVHAYVATEWMGEITETDEMKKPVWFKIYEVPYDDAERVFPGDKLWLKEVLGGYAVKGEIFYNDDWSVDESKTWIRRVDGYARG